MTGRLSINRRQFLKSAGLAVLGAASACATPTPAPTPEPKKRVLRIAHMTDFHVQPEGIARNESVRALRHAHDQSDPTVQIASVKPATRYAAMTASVSVIALVGVDLVMSALG